MGPQNWFARIGTGYVLAKYGMTLITHGLSGELENDGIACNTLWPRTAVATAAVRNLLGGGPTIDGSRTPEIMADAAYEILTSDAKKTNDKFFIDDEVMAAVGVVDLNKYKVNPKVKDHELIIDFMC